MNMQSYRVVAGTDTEVITLPSDAVGSLALNLIAGNDRTDPPVYRCERRTMTCILLSHPVLVTGLLILQYCIGIASIGNTFFSIARVLQYFLKVGIGIGIANTFIEYWYLIYTNINSQYFSIAHRNKISK